VTIVNLRQGCGDSGLVQFVVEFLSLSDRHRGVGHAKRDEDWHIRFGDLEGGGGY
jgi:hypothetical protein